MMTKRFEDQKNILVSMLKRSFPIDQQMEEAIRDSMNVAFTEGWRSGVYETRESAGDHEIYPEAGLIPSFYGKGKHDTDIDHWSIE